MQQDKNHKLKKAKSDLEWIKVVDAAAGTPYSSEYLSLLARRKKLPAKKIDGIWYTTRSAISDYVSRQHLRERMLSSVNGGDFELGSADSVAAPLQSPGPVAVDAEHFVNRFDELIDAKIAREKTFFQKSSSALGKVATTIFSSKLLSAIFFVGLVLFLILPTRVFSGPLDDAFRGVVSSLKDAQTVMGFRPGTHANEVLLLDKNGDIAIFGHVETEGQFKSFAEDGIAPIVVTSTTKVDNLNVDFLDGASSEDFTLAFVTANGNITFEDVQLEGNVEVGKTLLVRGAAKLLSTLEVDGELTVFDDATLKKNLKVDGDAYVGKYLHAFSIFAKDRIFAQNSISTDGNLTVRGQSVFDGFVLINDSLGAKTGSFSQGLGTSGKFVAGGDVELGGDNSAISITANGWSISDGGGANFSSVSATTLESTGTTTAALLSATKLKVTGSATSTFAGPLAPSSGNFVIDTGTSTQYILLNPYTGGNVGIGTSSPYRTLSVAGDAAITGDLSVGTFTVTGTLSAGNFNATNVSATSTYAGGFTVDTNGLVYDWNTNRVGIGTTSPTNLLTVAGNANITGTFDVAGASTFGNLIAINATTTSATSTNLYVSGQTRIASLTGPLQAIDGIVSATSTISDVFITDALTISGGTINNTPIGAATPSTGVFTLSTSTSATSTNFAISSLTAGSVPFIGVGGTLRDDNANLFWDDTNNRLGIGTTSPSSPLTVNGDVRFGEGNEYNGLFFDATNGRLGLGTASPFAQLVVSNQDVSGGSTNIAIQQSSTGTGSISFIEGNSLTTAGLKLEYNGSTNRLDFADTNDGDIHVSILRTGRLGIGNVAPAEALNVQGEAAAQFFTATSTTATSTFAGSLAVDTNVLLVDSFTNRVGIGTSSPAATLGVAGDIFATGDLTVGGLDSTDAVTAPYFVANNTTATSTFAGGITVAGNKFVIDPDGLRVGVGTSTPATNFAVTGSGYFTGGLGIGVATTAAGALQTTGDAVIGGALTVTGTGQTSIVNGRVRFTGVPTGTNPEEGTFYINPPSAGTNNVLVGIAVGGTEKVRIDAEGDIQLVGTINSTNTSGTNSFSGGLSANGNVTLGDTEASDTVTFNSRISSNLTPSADNNYSLGTPTLRWSNIYAATTTIDNLVAGGTASSTFIINEGNGTADTEDSSLQFERGSETPNAIIKWDSSNDRFDFNDFPVYLQNRLIAAGTASSSFAGPVWLTGTPQAQDIRGGSLYINPSSGSTNFTLLGIGVAGVERFRVDAEGDTTVQGTLGVENALYDITESVLTINDSLKISGNEIQDSGDTTRIQLGSTNSVTGNLDVSGNFTADGTGTHYFSDGSLGVGTTSPGATLEVDGDFRAGTGNNFNTLFADVSEGKVGILDGTPSYELDVTGRGHFTSFVDASHFVATSTTATSTFAGGFAVETNGLVYDRSTNRVGIGTASPGASLEVGAGGGGILLANNNFLTGHQSSGVGVGQLIGLDTSNFVSLGGTNTSGFKFTQHITELGQIRRSVDGVSYFNNVGNFGIGNTVPTAELDVQGEVLAQYFNATSTSATSTFAGGFAVETNGLVYDRSTNRVGIGTASPSAPLTVSGNVRFDGTTLTLASGSTDSTPVALSRGSANRLDLASGDSFQIVSGSLIFAGTTVITSGRLIQAAAGSASAPSLSFSADTNTGIYNTADTLLFSTGGSERVRIDSSGRLGIGDSSPAAALTVGSGDLFQVNSSGAIAAATGITSSGTITFSGLSNGVVQSTSGVLSATSSISGSFIEDVFLKNNADDTTTGQLTAANFVASSASATSTFAGGLAVDTNLLFVDPYLNRIGIGTVSPESQLTIARTETTVYDDTDTSGQRDTGVTLRLNNLSAVTDTFAQIEFQTRSSSFAQARIVAVNQGANNVDLAFVTESGSPSEKLRITGSGNIGIGNKAPTNKLNVQGDVAAQYFVATSTTATSTFVGGVAVATDALTVNTSGKVGIGTDNPLGLLHVSDNVSGSFPVYFQNRAVGGSTTGTVDLVSVQTGSEFANGRITFGRDGAYGSSAAADGYIALSPALDGTDTERVRITSEGNVGVGTTSPDSILTVNGDVRFGEGNEYDGFFYDATNARLGLGTASPSAALEINSAVDTGGGYYKPLRVYNPSLTTGETVQVAFGKENATNNQAELNFVLSGGAGSSSNYVGLGLFGVPNALVVQGTGRVGIGDSSPAALLTVGSGDLFQVNSSGAIAAATGITSSGTVTFSGLTANRLVVTTTGGQLSNSITSANIASSVTNEVGSGSLVFGTSPQFTTSVTTGSATFSAFNTTATTLNIGGAATTLNLGATTGTLNLSNPTIASPASTLTLFNTTPTTINFAGGATALNIGSASGTTTLAGGLTVDTTTLVADRSTDKVGIGTASPLAKLHVTSGSSGVTSGTLSSATRLLVESAAGAVVTIATPSGSSGSLIFADESANSGSILYHHPTDSLRITVNSSEVARFDSAGNFGIGTTSPSAKLSVAGNIYADGDIIVSGLIATSSISAPYFVTTNANATSTFAGGVAVATDALTVNTSGKVGIGTDNPLGLLHVSDNVSGSFPVYFQNRAVGGTTTGTVDLVSVQTGSEFANGRITFGRDGAYGTSVAADGYIALSPALNGTDTEQVRITSDGNVGIGTSSPQQILHVYDNQARIFIDTGNSSGQTGVVFGDNGVNSGSIKYDNSDDSLRFTTNGQNLSDEKLRITANGFVGVLNTSPSYELDVTGRGHFTSFVDASHFVATSTTATSTFAGGLTVDGTDFVVDPDAGKVGIGTLTPQRALHINSGNVNIGLRVESTDTRAIIALVDDSTSDDGQVSVGAFGNDLELGAGGDNDALTIQSDSDVIVTAGNFGIATSSPSSPLTVNGDVRFGEGNLYDGFFYDATNGRLGIGTDSPTYGLDIQKTSNTVGARVSSNTANDIFYYGTGTVTGNTNFFNTAISATGNLQATLYNTNTTDGSAKFSAQVGGVSSDDPYYDLTVTGATNWTIGVDNSDSDKLKIGPNANPSTGTASLTVTTGGLAGINQTSPADQFQITDGSGHITFGTLSGANAGLTFRNAAVAASNYSLLGNGTDTFVSRPSGGVIQFREANSTQVTLDTGGNFGIATTSPDSPLTVTGDVRFGEGNLYDGFFFDATNGRLGINTDTPDTELHIRSDDAGGPYVTLDDFGASNARISYNNGQLTFGADEANDLGTGSVLFRLNGSGNSTLNSVGLGIKDTTPSYTLDVSGYARFTGLVDASHFVATSTTATSTFAGSINVGNGALQYDYGSNKTTIERLDLGPLSFDTNAGKVSWIDLPITSLVATGTPQAYSAQLDSEQILTIWGESAGRSVAKTRVIVGTTTDSVLTSSNIPYGSLLVADGIICVDDGGAANCDDAERFAGGLYATSTTVTAVDLAEQYPTKDATLKAGELVMFDASNEVFVSRYEKSTSTPQGQFVGVVSTAPGVLLGGFANQQFSEEIEVPIALSGRVPVKVNLEGGSIAVGDRLVPSSVPGVARKATTSGMTLGIALEAVTASSTESVVAFIDPSFTFVPDQFYFAENGNIGIGTTTPQYEFQVAGNVAANSFVNVSTEESKKEIEHIDEKEKEGILDKIKTIEIATYKYKYEGESDPTRLGLIAEEAPTEVLSTDRKGVDIYKLATFALTGVQTLAKKFDDLVARVDALEVALAGAGNVAISVGNSINDFVAETLNVGTLVVNNVYAQGLTVGSEENRAGITLFDKNTGEPFCVAVIDGETKATAGACEEFTGDSDAEGSDITAPEIILIGNNPARINVGDIYGDLGARLGNDENFTIHTFVNGAEVATVSIDTSSDSTHEIVYRATDQAGNSGEISRTVIVGTGGVTEDIGTSTPTTTPSSVDNETTGDAATSTPSVLGESILGDTASSTPVEIAVEDPIVEAVDVNTGTSTPQS